MVFCRPDVQEHFYSNINSDPFDCLELDLEFMVCEVEVNPCGENLEGVELSS